MLSRRRKSCKYGKLKKPIRTKSGGKRRCKRKTSRRIRKSCKYGKLKKPIKTKSGGKRRCKKSKRKLNAYFIFANKHRKKVMKDLKSKGLSGKQLITKTAKILGKMYRERS